MAKLFIGIDIGTRLTKVVELESKQKPQIINAFFFPTPYIGAQQGFSQLDTKFFFSEITKVIPLNKLHTAKIGVNIPAFAITAIPVFLPRMPEKELFLAAINEAKRSMLPVSNPNHTFECDFLGEKMVGKVLRCQVLVVRTEKTIIQKILELFQDNEVIPSLVSPAAFTVLNILSKEAWDKNEDTVFVDLGVTSINISVYREARLFFTRSIMYGLKDIMADIAYHLDLSDIDIENSVRELGVPQIPFDLKDKVAIAEEIMRQKYEVNQGESPSNKPQVNFLELRMLWQPHLERIVHELRRSFAFYKEESGGRRIGYIHFLGGASQIKNLVNTLSAQIGGQCKVILPFKGLAVPANMQQQYEADITPIFANATSFSFTMASLDKKRYVLNFLPMELKQKEMIIARRLVMLIVGVSLIAVFSLASLNLLIQNYSFRRSMQVIEFELSRVKRVTERLNNLSQQEKNLKLFSTEIDVVSKEKQDFSLLLQELVKAIPESALLKKVVISKEKLKSGGEVQAQNKSGETDNYWIQIEGQVFADYEAATRLVKDFQQRLEETVYFSNINAKPLKLEEIEEVLLHQGAKGAIDSPLTLPCARDFSVSAEIKKF